MAPHSSTLAWKIHWRRSLVGCSPWGHEESDTTERLHFYFSLLCIGEGNGNPLQYSCLENPRDGEPGGLPSMGSHRVGHDWSDLAAAADKRKIHLPPLSVHWVSIEFKSTQQDSLTVLPKLTANQEQKQRFLAAKNSFAAFAFLSFLPLDLKDEAQVRSRANKCMAHNHALRSEIPALGACARKLPRGCMVRLSMELLQVVASIPHVWKWYT